MSDSTNTAPSEPATGVAAARARLAGTSVETVRQLITTHALRLGHSHTATAFLVALVVFAASWRVDAFIVDTVAVANALANLADGSLHLATVYYGPADAQTPGVYAANGRLYGRNYGQVVAALPVLYALRGLSLVAAPGLLLAGAWSLAIAELGRRASGMLGDARLAWLGLGLATLTFLANAAFGTALEPRLYPLVALQVVTVGAAAALVATAYRLTALFHGHRVGVAAAATTLLVGPVAFWATIPKRHVITAFLVLLCAFLFARSRVHSRLTDRALAYIPVGLTAWVSAPEGFLLLAALVPVDIATALRRDPRALATVAVALAVGLVPFFLTNLAISGNPMLPPRLLTSYRSGGVTLAVEPTVAPSNPMADPTATPATGGPTSGEAAADAGGSTRGGGGGVTLPAPTAVFAALSGVVTAATAAAVSAVEAVYHQATRGLAALAPERLSHVFLRSGRIPGVDYSQTGGETIELTLVESAPILAALIAAPVAALRGGVGRRLPTGWPSLRDCSPARAVDLFVVVFTMVFTLVHLPRLPLHATVTVRYLTPVVPLLVYGVFRLAAVRAVVTEHGRTVLLTATVAVVGGGVAWVAGFALLAPTVGTAMQTHAVVNLATAVLVAGWLVLVPDNRRVGAVALGLTIAAMALFLVGTGFEYFAADRRFLLPVARLIETALPLIPAS